MKVSRWVIIPGDGLCKYQENKLKLLETSDGDIMISIDTYNHERHEYVSSGVVQIKSGHTGGKKQALLVQLRKVINQALELKQKSPLSRIEGWGNAQ